jgi:TetR/AcrR family transcriptional regulator, cholesterol catabolism regulator
MLRAAGPPPPEELRRDLRERRERIVRAALKALANSDHESVKISEVARDANVALGTVYRYFSSKEHLFAAAFYEWQHAMKVRLETGALAEAPEQDRLREVFHRTIKAFQVQPQFFRVLMVLQTTTDSYAAEVYESLSLQFEEIVAAAFDGPIEGDRRAVLVTLQAVLYNSLRIWVTGRGSIKSAYQDVDNALRLMYRTS